MLSMDEKSHPWITILSMQKMTDKIFILHFYPWIKSRDNGEGIAHGQNHYIGSYLFSTEWQWPSHSAETTVIPFLELLS